MNLAEFSCIEMCLMTNQLQRQPSTGTKFDVISRHQKVQPFHSVRVLTPRFRESAFYFGHIVMVDRCSWILIICSTQQHAACHRQYRVSHCSRSCETVHYSVFTDSACILLHTVCTLPVNIVLFPSFITWNKLTVYTERVYHLTTYISNYQQSCF
jgi:hypothetical protein